MPGVMCISDAGARTVKEYVAISVDATVCPHGRMNTLLDGLPVRGHGSSLVPTLDDAPLSATADSIDPFSTPHLICHRFSRSRIPGPFLVLCPSCSSVVMLEWQLL